MSIESGQWIAACQNCGTSTLVASMWRDRRDGSLHCVECPGEGWLRANYGQRAARDLIGLRERQPGCLSLGELVRRYPDPLEVGA